MIRRYNVRSRPVDCDISRKRAHAELSVKPRKRSILLVNGKRDHPTARTSSASKIFPLIRRIKKSPIRRDTDVTRIQLSPNTAQQLQRAISRIHGEDMNPPFASRAIALTRPG